MAKKLVWLKNFCADESGQDLVEYGLIAGLLALGSIATLQGVANNIATLFAAVGTTLTTAL